MTHGDAARNDDRDTKSDGEAGARHGQVTGAWRILAVSLVLAVIATAIVGAFVMGG